MQALIIAAGRGRWCRGFLLWHRTRRTDGYVLVGEGGMVGGRRVLTRRDIDAIEGDGGAKGGQVGPGSMRCDGTRKGNGAHHVEWIKLWSDTRVQLTFR